MSGPRAPASPRRPVLLSLMLVVAGGPFVVVYRIDLTAATGTDEEAPPIGHVGTEAAHAHEHGHGHKKEAHAAASTTGNPAAGAAEKKATGGSGSRPDGCACMCVVARTRHQAPRMVLAGWAWSLAVAHGVLKLFVQC